MLHFSPVSTDETLHQGSRQFANPPEFEASIEEFKKHILRTPSLHSTFADMWDPYGSLFFNGCTLSTDENDVDHTQFLYQGYSAEWEL